MAELSLSQSQLDTAGVYNARAPIPQRQSLLLRVCHPTLGEASRECLGEAAPLPGFSKESLAETQKSLGALSFENFQQLYKRLCADLDQGRQLPQALHSLQPAGPPSAVFALQCALLDALGLQRSLSIAGLMNEFGGSASAAPLTAPERTFSQSAHLLSIHAPTWRDGLQSLVERGARCIKVKIGLDPELEQQRLAELTRAEPQLRYRLDANGQLGPDFERCLAGFAAEQLEFVEEPVPLAELGSVRQLPCPLALDESLLSAGALAAVRPWLDRGLLKAVVLKPMLHGDLNRTFTWAELARTHHAEVVLSHCFDGPVAMAMYRQLAAVLGSAELAQGLGEHPGLALWAVDLKSGSPGLGLELS